jgi:hypothetical protein
MGSMENRREYRADKGSGFKRWWANEEAPSPMMLALLAVTGLSGLFVVANLLIEVILK